MARRVPSHRAWNTLSSSTRWLGTPLTMGRQARGSSGEPGTPALHAVVVGADRVAANGDTANKIGTYALACAAAHNGVPFVVVAPESTVDPGTARGTDIPIEERDGAEVTHLAGTGTTVPGTRAYNPAFDVTPAELITAIVTERRTWRPAHPGARGTAALAQA